VMVLFYFMQQYGSYLGDCLSWSDYYLGEERRTRWNLPGRSP
jgi:hypothetical protein